MENRKLFTGLDHYNRYIKVISDIIRDHEYYLAIYVRVKNIGLHSV